LPDVTHNAGPWAGIVVFGILASGSPF